MANSLGRRQLDVAGSDACAGAARRQVTVGYVAAGAPSLVLARVAAHDGLDDATVQFFLQQVLQARTAEEEEEEEAKEVAEVKELEDDLVLKESRLVEALERDRAGADRAAPTGPAH